MTSKKLWRHSSVSNANFNITMLQILLLVTLYPLASVSMEKDVSCLSLYDFCVLVTWLAKYGHDYQNWRQSVKEQPWPKTKPRILREPKIWQFEVICSNRNVVKGLLPKMYRNKISTLTRLSKKFTSIIISKTIQTTSSGPGKGLMIWSTVKRKTRRWLRQWNAL